MIISDKYKFAFVHIPKCAGSSVRRANPSINDPFLEQHFIEHEVLGTLHVAHIPLDVLRDYFPDYMERVMRYESFAVMREPMDRFCSSVAQRCRLLGYTLAEITPELLMDVALNTIDVLRDPANRMDVNYVHFLPQADFIELDGERIINHIDLAGDFRHLNDFLRKNGLNAISDSPPRNMNFGLAYGLFNPVVKPVQLLGRRVLPQMAKDRIWRVLVTAGFLKRRSSGYEQMRGHRHIAEFVQSHYAEDHELYETLPHIN